MATIKCFEDLDSWKMARNLNIKLLPIIKKLDTNKYFDLKGQLERSSGSVMDNIAEGYERAGNREFIQFLAIAKGSLGEVRSQLYRTYDRKVINEVELEEFQNECKLLAGKIANFMTYLRRSDIKGEKFKPKSL
ncbi:MAG: four helix bundle protein [Bacteroidia bacterium]